MGCAQRAASAGRCSRRTSCSRASAPASGSGSASSCRRDDDPLLDHRLRHRRAARGRRPATTSTTSATPARSPTPRLRCRPSRSPTSPPARQGAVIEVLAALLTRAQTGRGGRLSISMTHGSHQFVAHRLAGDPVERLLTGGVACYRIYETADGRYLTVAALEPKFWQRLCELLDRPDLAERAFEPELPELEALFRTRTMREWLDLLEHEDTCVGPVLSLAESARSSREAALRSPSRSSGSTSAPHRTHPGRLRAGLEPERRAHRLRDARRPLGRGRRRQPSRAARRERRPARLGAERAAARVRARRLGLDDPGGRRSTSGSSRAARIPTGRPTARASPSTVTARPTPRSGGTAARRRTPAPAPTPRTRPTAGSRSSPTARSPSRRRRRAGHVTGLVGGRAARVGARRDDLHRGPRSTTAARSRPGRPHAARASSCPTSTSARRPGS